uniref:Trehalase n=1 Tax=Varanus komodoensis TaxID=61221 RepID=A0A8D2JF90_VARKO
CFSHCIYCTGELLRQVQQAQLFTDDKHFVDMPLRAKPEEVLGQFQQLVNATPGGGALSRQQLAAFVEAHFFPPGQELQAWEPPDWTSSPPLLQRILDEKLRFWAQELISKWKQLGSPRALSLASPPPPLRGRGDSVCDFPSRDSFWIIEGLLLSGMAATAEGMIQNFLFLVEKFGHIPNGGRVYYERRSQPPFLTLMMESYLKHTNSTSFLRRNIHLLEAEYRFWQQQRAVNISTGGQQYQLNRYRVPESGEQGVLQACSLWAELKTAAESGWDFSSRWFLPGPRSTQATLRDTKASEVVPVDLNAILCRVERLLATFYRELGNSQKADSFQAAHEQRVAAIRAVLWDDQAGSWFDYDLLQQRKSTAFYPSNVAPLWAECGVDAAVVEKALGYLQGSSALSYANGLPASLARTGQQWDLPNAWAPLQHMVIEGLAKSSLPQAQELAFTLAQRWVRMNLAVYERHHAMFEKYVVEGDGEPGTGGEYPVQVGFGWTNGVVLQLLDRYGSRLTSTGALVTPMLPWIGTCLALALL